MASSATGCTAMTPLYVAPKPDQLQFQQAALSIHNQLRAQHQAPNLVWDAALANFAERYASKCKFQHSRSGYGENLAVGYPSISVVINAWYAENQKYNYAHPGFSRSTGHVTQLVWKSTKKLGCGYAICNGKNGTPGKLWVCEYSPAGNISSSGYFQANVLPFKSQS